jgi:preprotein translocase subunit SecG
MRKSTKLIVVLLFLNALTFSFVLSRTKSQQTNENQTEQIVNQNKYIKAGTLVIDWSYRMLHYFKN